MPDERGIVLYSTEEKLSPAIRRQRAVEAALTIIKARSEGAGQDLTTLFNHLSEYADQIQAALEAKAK